MTDEEQKQNEAKPLNIVEEARLIRDEIIKAKDELKAEKEALAKLQSESLLSSSAGGRIEPVMVSPEDAKVNAAKDFFKGTELETAINKANVKK